MRSRVPRTVLLLSLAAALASGQLGCKKKLFDRRTGSQAAPTAPPTPVWKDHEVSFREIDAKGNFHVGSTKLDVSFRSLPAGTTIATGNDRRTADASGNASLQVDLGATIAKLPPRDAFDYKFRLDPRAKVELDFGGGVKLTLDAPATSVSYGLTEMFKKAVDAPINLPPPETAPAEHTVVLLGAGSADAIGPATTVDAIDWAATVTNLPERSGKTCSGYSKSGTKDGDKSFVLKMVDQRVDVFDVRTSRPVSSREFKAREDCPMMAFGNAAKTYASTDEQKAWLRELRTGKR